MVRIGKVEGDQQAVDGLQWNQPPPLGLDPLLEQCVSLLLTQYLKKV